MENLKYQSETTDDETSPLEGLIGKDVLDCQGDLCGTVCGVSEHNGDTLINVEYRTLMGRRKVHGVPELYFSDLQDFDLWLTISAPEFRQKVWLVTDDYLRNYYERRLYLDDDEDRYNRPFLVL